MDWSEFQKWLLPGAISGLCIVIWDARRRLENAQTALATKVDAVHSLMQTELRTMDVRIAIIEAHLWPDRVRK